MKLSNWPGPSGRVFWALVLAGGFQVINFNLIYEPLKSEWYALPAAILLVVVNFAGTVAYRFPKWGRYLWLILFLVNFGLVSQGLILVAGLLGADVFVAWVIGLPLWVFLSVQLHRHFLWVLRTG